MGIETVDQACTLPYAAQLYAWTHHLVSKLCYTACDACPVFDDRYRAPTHPKPCTLSPHLSKATPQMVQSGSMAIG